MAARDTSSSSENLESSPPTRRSEATSPRRSKRRSASQKRKRPDQPEPKSGTADNNRKKKPEMNSGDEEMRSTPRSRADDLPGGVKDHIEATAERVAARMTMDFKNMFESMCCKVTQNSENIGVIQQTIARIESSAAQKSVLNIAQVEELIDRKMLMMATAAGSNPNDPTQCSGRDMKYDVARRSLRLWSIPGESDPCVRAATIRFIQSKLEVDSSDFNPAQLISSRRAKAGK